MKRLLLSAVAALLTLAASGTANAGTEAILRANTQSSAMLVGTHVDYAETGNGTLGTNTGLLDTEKGWVGGGAFSISMMDPGSLIYIDASYSRFNGRTDYVGAPITGGAYGSSVGTSTATISDYSLRLGKGFALGNGTMLTPFAEIGHHRWYRGVNSGETYNHNYYGGGALLQTTLGMNVVVTLSGMAGKTSHSNISVAGSNGFSGSLGNSTTYRFGASADYPLSPSLHLKAGADYTSFKYGMSSIFPVAGGSSWEPDSRTHYIVVKAGIGISF